MQSNCRTASSCKFLRGIFIAAFVALPFSATALAQQSQKSPCANPTNQVLKTLYLPNSVERNDVNEILVTIRNMVDPCVKVYLVQSQNIILINAPQDQIAIAEKIIQDLDHPKKSYRLTFTITDFDGTNKTGTRHYALIVAANQRVTLKQGSKVPVITGSYNRDAGASETQNTYLDVGMNLDATVRPCAGGMELLSKVEQSSIAQQTSEIGPHDPIVHQAVIEGVAMLSLGKPAVLGALDVPDSQKRMEISVVAEALP
jgi:type II secretory pathway component GspD/PulD (secretin)